VLSLKSDFHFEKDDHHVGFDLMMGLSMYHFHSQWVPCHSHHVL